MNERDYVQSLARGLAVLRGFADNGPNMTLAEVANAADISRPAARRLLLTLVELGYVTNENGTFALAARVLSFAQAYLASLSLVELAQPHMRDVAAETGESCSLGAIDGTDVVFLGRVGADRIMSSAIVVGSRLPLYATAMGRVLLAELPPASRAELVSRSTIVPLARRTVTDVPRLLQILDEAHKKGWALVDQELEDGLRSVAVPIFGQNGECVASLGATCHTGRVSKAALVSRVLPLVRQAGERTSAALGYRKDDMSSVVRSASVG